MSRGGVVVDQVVACPGIGSGQAADALVSIVGGAGEYRAVRVASDRVQFARTFRPTWATALGWCLLPIALLGIVFFFVRTTETCVAVVEADHRGTRVRLSGRLDAAVLARLQQTFHDPAGAARDAAVATAVGAPVDVANALAPPPLRSAPSLPASLVPAGATAGPAVPTPPTPVVPSPVVPSPPESGGWVPVWEREDPAPPAHPSVPSMPQFDPSSTIMVPRRHGGGAPQLSAVLDDGEELDLSDVVLLGRDPSPGATENTASLVRVADPERSVSKTHLKLEVLGGVLMATDRGSTNGSAIVSSDGSTTAMEPGVATEVPAGCAVRFGTRTVRVLSTGSAGGSL